MSKVIGQTKLLKTAQKRPPCDAVAFLYHHHHHHLAIMSTYCVQCARALNNMSHSSISTHQLRFINDAAMMQNAAKHHMKLIAIFVSNRSEF